MGQLHFDWRWIAVIAVLVVLVSYRQIPWPVIALVLGGGGIYLLRTGWQTWTRYGGRPGGRRVTYWRGQRIELEREARGPRLPRWRDIGPAIIPLLLGGVMLLGAITLVLDAVGL